MSEILAQTIRARYLQTLERIQRGAQSAGRNPATVRLVVVTKKQPLERVQAVLEAGARDLGENYAEEGAAKIQAIGPMDGLRWHMIGHLQRNKVKAVLPLVSLIHSVDSLRLAEELDAQAAKIEKRQPAGLGAGLSFLNKARPLEATLVPACAREHPSTPAGVV